MKKRIFEDYHCHKTLFHKNEILHLYCFCIYGFGGVKHVGFFDGTQFACRLSDAKIDEKLDLTMNTVLAPKMKLMVAKGQIDSAIDTPELQIKVIDYLIRKRRTYSHLNISTPIDGNMLPANEKPCHICY